MEQENNIFFDHNPLADLIKVIKEENPLYNEDDIKNAINEAQKAYQPEAESAENLVNIKKDALNMLDWNKSLE